MIPPPVSNPIFILLFYFNPVVSKLFSFPFSLKIIFQEVLNVVKTKE